MFELSALKGRLLDSMKRNEIVGTVIIAEEGYNATVCGKREGIEAFVPEAEKILLTKLKYKSSFHLSRPFRRSEVKVKREIVTLKKRVEISKGAGTFLDVNEWNELISDPQVVLIDARNDYEYQSGTFRGAVNPATKRFSELPEFVERNFGQRKDTKIAMFCTGGIRCEKIVPYLKEIGYGNVFQLDGGILKYLETVPANESLWQGECFVFDDRISVGEDLKKGKSPDFSTAVRKNEVS